jgi:transcriptional regulator with XRE-family HTH domain
MAKIEHISSGEKLGSALKRLRNEKKISQAELAKKMRMRQPTISAIENGRGTIQSLFKVIQALQLNLSLESGEASSKAGKKSRAQEILDLLE